MLTCHLVDEVSDRLVDEVAFEFIPIDNQATGTSILQLEEGAQGAEDAGCRLSQTSGGLVNSTAFFIALKTLSTICSAFAMMSPGQVLAIPNVGSDSSTSVVKPTEVW